MTVEQIWPGVGLVGQAFFSTRFLGQEAGLFVYARNLYFIHRAPGRPAGAVS